MAKYVYLHDIYIIELILRTTDLLNWYLHSCKLISDFLRSIFLLD